MSFGTLKYKRTKIYSLGTNAEDDNVHGFEIIFQYIKKNVYNL